MAIVKYLYFSMGFPSSLAVVSKKIVLVLLSAGLFPVDSHTFFLFLAWVSLSDINFLNNSFLCFLAKLSKKIGVTPLTALQCS